MGWVFPVSPFSFKTIYKMGKICLSKISKNFLRDCKLKLNGIAEMYLVAFSDISGFAYVEDSGDTVLNNIVLAEGANSVLVEGYKNAIKVTQSLRAGDYLNCLAQTITFPVYGKDNDFGVKAVLNGKFVAFTKMNDLTYRCYGLYQGLEVSAADSDTNTNAGTLVLSLTTPEGSTGEYPLTFSSSIWNILETAKLAQ